MITKKEADDLRDRYNAYEAARRGFDPKRFQRGGGYTPADEKRITEAAGVTRPTNEEMSRLEIYEFVTAPPERYFLYVQETTKKATTFMGDVLGDITLGRRYKAPSFGSAYTASERVPVSIRAINGYTYSGTYYASSGSYARVKRGKPWRQSPRKGL